MVLLLHAPSLPFLSFPFTKQTKPLQDRLQQQQGGEAAEEEEEGKVRKAFERAVTAAGTHVAEGHKIWGAYRSVQWCGYVCVCGVILGRVV